jgi:hypothetical protein
MNNDRLVRQLEEIEHALTRDDPRLVQRFRRLGRRDTITTLIVGVLLAVGTVFLTHGIATLSFATWVIGVAAFIACFVADRRPGRPDALRSTPRDIHSTSFGRSGPSGLSGERYL